MTASELGRRAGSPRVAASGCALLVALAAATGCGGGAQSACANPDGGVGGVTLTNEPLDGFIDQLARAMCGWQFRCCDPPEIDAMGAFSYLTESECQAVTTRLLAEAMFEVRSSLNMNRTVIDQTLAMSCVRSFTEGTCNPTDKDFLIQPLSVWDRFNACPNPFGGRVPADSACFLATECREGSTCTTGGLTAPTTMATITTPRVPLSMADGLASFFGHCLPDRQLGDACLTTLECAPGLYCRMTDFVCARPAKDGEPCSVAADVAGNVLATLIACDGNLICADKRCRRLPRQGEPCVSLNLNQAANTPACDPSPELGLSCAGRGFNGDGVCQKATPSGGVCSNGGGLPACALPLACIADNTGDPGLGVCGPPPTAGSPCSADTRCAAPAVCYLDFNPVCVVPGKIRFGGSCMTDLDCLSLNCQATSQPITQDAPGTCVAASALNCSGRGTAFVATTNPPLPTEVPDGGLPMTPAQQKARDAGFLLP